MDKQLKMFLVSDINPNGSQWWVIHYSAEEAAAMIDKNNPSSAFKAEQVPFTDKRTWGAHLSLDPHANDDVVYKTTAEVVAGYSEPDIFGGAGGGMLCRQRIDGKSHEIFIYHSDGNELHVKRDMSEEGSNVIQIPVYKGDPFKVFVQSSIVEIELNKEVGFRMVDGNCYVNGADIHIARKRAMIFGLINYSTFTESSYENHFFVFASVYAFRDDSWWKKMNQFEFKEFKRFIEDARPYDDWGKVAELISKNEIYDEW